MDSQLLWTRGVCPLSPMSCIILHANKRRINYNQHWRDCGLNSILISNNGTAILLYFNQWDMFITKTRQTVKTKFPIKNRLDELGWIDETINQ